MQTGDKRGAIEHKLTELWHRRATGCIYGGMDAGHRQYYRSQLLELTGIWERFRREIELSKQTRVAHAPIISLMNRRIFDVLHFSRQDVDTCVARHGIITQLVVARGARSLKIIRPEGPRGQNLPTYEPWGVDAGVPLPETKRSSRPRRPAWRP